MVDTHSNKQRGFFCVFEGINAAGKTTVIRELKQLLNAELMKPQPRALSFNGLHIACEPSRNPLGKKIRRHLLEKSSLSARNWLHMFMRDRWQQQVSFTVPHLQKNWLIISDRYYYSSAAYQGCSKNYSPEKIIRLHQRLGYIKPHLIFYLRLDPQISLQRQNQLVGTNDIHENVATLVQIQKNYEHIFQNIVTNKVAIMSTKKQSALDIAQNCLTIIKENIKKNYAY